MAEKDRTTKLLEDHADVFADILNTLLFKKELINPEDLADGPTESIYKTESDETADQRRDVLKRYLNGYLLICSVGIENQVSVDLSMPVRVMKYDAASYAEQVKSIKERRRNDGTVKMRIRPVITVVLNFSSARWGKAKSLKNIMDIPDELKPYVSNYKIRVFDIAWLNRKTIDGFHSDFRIVADFFRQSRLNKKYQPPGDIISHVGEVMEFLSVFSGDARYREAIPEVLKKQRELGGFTMVNFIDQFEKTRI